MLATIENSRITKVGPEGGGMKWRGEFHYRINGEGESVKLRGLNMGSGTHVGALEVPRGQAAMVYLEMIVMGQKSDEESRAAVAEAINNKLCAEIPYDVLMEIEVLPVPEGELRFTSDGRAVVDAPRARASHLTEVTAALQAAAQRNLEMLGAYDAYKHGAHDMRERIKHFLQMKIDLMVDGHDKELYQNLRDSLDEV